MKKTNHKNTAFLQQTYQRRFNQFQNEKEFRDDMWKILIKNYFQQFIPRDSTVLDIPSGYGEFITNITAKKKIAIDLNFDSKKFLPKNVQFIICSSDSIRLTKNSVDIIFVSNFFEHISREMIQKTMKEFYRILKSHGKVLVLQPNIRFIQKDYWMFFDHVTPIDDRALDEIFEINKMKLIYKVEKFLPFSTKLHYPKSLWLVNLYLRVPFLWRFFGQQSFLIYEKTA